MGEDLQVDFHLRLLGLICSLIFGEQEHTPDKHTYTYISVTFLSFLLSLLCLMIVFFYKDI